MTMITRCPACETAFRITEAQLNTAKGAVRCGSCLQIFRAMDNLVPGGGQELAAGQKSAPAQSTSQSQRSEGGAHTKPVRQAAQAGSGKARPQNTVQAGKGEPGKVQAGKVNFEYRRPAGASIRPATSPATATSAASPKPNTLQSPAPSVRRTAPAHMGLESDLSDDLALDVTDESNSAGSFTADDSADYEGLWQQRSQETPAADAGQENMLRFDQRAIDSADDAAEGLFADEMLISDEMSLPDEDTPRRASSSFDDELSDAFLELDGLKPSRNSLFDRDPRARARDDNEEMTDADESWALSLLEEEDGAQTDIPSSPAPARPSRIETPAAPEDPFEDLEILPEEDSEFELHSSADPGSFGSEELMAEEPVQAESAEWEMEEWQAEAPEELEPEDEDDFYEEDFTGGAYTDDDRHQRNSLLSRIEPEPVEFATYNGRNWRKGLLWGSLSALGLVLLVAQVAWLQFDRLSRLQPYRDVYGAVCPLVGCELPSLAAPNLIRTSNLVVRSHPQADGALMVDTILLNTASFQQPFPDLVLTFSDIHGQVLASRRFTPGEYLAGELAGRMEMPSNQPVHLSLEIVDPGPNAVNYSAYIPD